MTIITVSIDVQGNYIINNGEMYVPNNPSNRDYNTVQIWISEGGVPTPYTLPSPPAPVTDIEKIEAILGMSESRIRLALGV